MSQVSAHASSARPAGVETSEAVLQLAEVGLCYPDGTRALSDVHLRLSPGEFVAIVGPSGCGKSSLLRVISGLLPPSCGTVQVDSKRLGFTFQEPTLMPWRTVQHNVEVLLELRRVPKQQRRQRARQQLALMGLEAFAQHYPSQLSGGMKMRVSLARSLVLEPNLFLLDEPFASLDTFTRQRLNSALLARFVRERFAVLLVTHTIAEAVFMAQRVLVMSERPGHIIAEFAVPFSYPRADSMRYSPTFNQLCARIEHLLVQP